MDRGPRSDEQLLATTADDPAAFAEFYRRYEEAILVYMLRRTRGADLAADLTAEVFAGALAGAARFRPQGVPAAAWLFGIAHNVLSTSYRKARVQNAMRRRLGMPQLELTEELVEHVERLGEIAAGEEAMARLAHLPPDQRAAIEARVLDEREYADIAGELVCSASVVRQRVSRGLAALRSDLEGS